MNKKRKLLILALVLALIAAGFPVFGQLGPQSVGLKMAPAVGLKMAPAEALKMAPAAALKMAPAASFKMALAEPMSTQSNGPRLRH